MAFTYTGNPKSVPIDAVRFWCGDVDATTAELQDGEILYAISLEPNDARLAGAVCLDALANKYARRADFAAGYVRKMLGSRSDALRKRAMDLRNEAGKLAMPFFGGPPDTGSPQPPFTMHQFDNELTTQFDQTSPDDTSNQPGD